MPKPRWSKEDLEPQICVSAIIRHPEIPHYILLQKNKKLRKIGVPGGKAKPGDNAFVALQRELLEECGIYITSAKLLDYKVTDVYRNGKRMSVPIYLYEILKYSGKITNKERDKHPWQAYANPVVMEFKRKALTVPLKMWLKYKGQKYGRSTSNTG